MAFVKFVNESYSDSEDIDRLHNYIKSSIYCIDYDGIAVNRDDAPFEMKMLKKLYFNMNGRQLIHMIVSFSKREYISSRMVAAVAPVIAEYYANQFQIFYGVHNNSGHVHIHYMMNSVSYIDGSKFILDYTDLKNFKNYIDNVVQNIFK